MKKAFVKLIVLLFCFPSFVYAQDKIPDEWAPWRDSDNPNVVVLKADDKDAITTRRDTSNDAKRDPGLVNPQRYAGGFMPAGGFPTYLGAPLAFNAEDLKAGKVEVALVGLSIEDQAIGGALYAANAMRTLLDYMGHPTGGTDPYLGVDYGTLVLADYGNVATHLHQNQRSLDEVHKVIAEILSADAMPVAIGGTHIQTYGVLTALAEKYGPKEFVVLHVDAHYDAYKSGR